MIEQDVQLQVVIADQKAIIILSLINNAEEFYNVVNNIKQGVELELISEQKTVRLEVDGKAIIYKGLMQEFSDNKNKIKFIMKDPERFALEFGDYMYEGYFQKGTRRKIAKEAKEVSFNVTNTITVGKMPTRLGMNSFTLSGIKNIIV